MPDGAGKDGISGKSCLPHILADINAEVPRGVCNKGLDRLRFDEEAIVTDGWDTIPKRLLLDTSTVAVKIGTTIRFPQPPTEWVIRSEERKVSIKRAVFGHPGIVCRIRANDARVCCRFAKIMEEVVPQELIVGAEEADNGSLRPLDAMGFGFLRVTFPLNEHLQLCLRKFLSVN